MILIDGKKEAALLREQLKKEVSDLKIKYNKVPGLTVILIGDLTPSQIYVRNKEKSANEVGLKSDVIKYPDSVEEKVILEKIDELNKDNSVSGILVQLPLPKHIDKQKIIEAIDPSKDVDGFHPMNVGNLSSGYESSVPCTPLGCYLLIKKIEPNLNGKMTLCSNATIVVWVEHFPIFLRIKIIFSMINMLWRNSKKVGLARELQYPLQNLIFRNQNLSNVIPI